MTTNTYKNAKSTGIVDVLTDVYVAPASGTATVVGMCISNTSEENIFVDVLLYDDSEADSAYIINSAPVPIGGSLIPIGGDQKLILESNDKLQVKTLDSDHTADVILSMLEIT